MILEACLCCAACRGIVRVRGDGGGSGDGGGGGGGGDANKGAETDCGSDIGMEREMWSGVRGRSQEDRTE